MYNEFFKFESPPFSLTPDPRFIFLSSGHQEVFDHMFYGVSEQKGFILISGHIGAGKTTLTRLFKDRLEDQARIALIHNGLFNEAELWAAIKREFCLATSSNNRQDMIAELTDFLEGLTHLGQNAVLILDEAQNLSVKVLEQIRLLSNLETENQKLLQIILVGQPELARTLTRPDLTQLNQRITVRCHLWPLGLEDSFHYIRHRLSIAGPENLVRFQPGSFRLIHRLTRGVPRRINALCDRTLLVAYSRGSHLIQPDFIRLANREVTGPLGPGRWRGFLDRLTPWRSHLTVAACLAWAFCS